MLTGMSRQSLQETTQLNLILPKNHTKDGKKLTMMQKIQFLKLLNSKFIFKTSLKEELMIWMILVMIHQMNEIIERRLLKLLLLTAIQK